MQTPNEDAWYDREDPVADASDRRVSVDDIHRDFGSNAGSTTARVPGPEKGGRLALENEEDEEGSAEDFRDNQDDVNRDSYRGLGMLGREAQELETDARLYRHVRQHVYRLA